MKKLLSVALVAIALLACHSDIWDSIDELKKDYESLSGRVSKLEELCKEMNTNISALQTLVNAQQTGDYITAVTPITKDGKEIGYVITFAKNTPVTIYHGSNGTSGIGGQGSDGSTPVVGVAQDTDGIYYWTLNGTWMLNDKGERIRVTGLNGSDGSDGSSGNDGTDGNNGSDGTNGKDGKDGITPQLKIENDYWYVSYDNGVTWAALGKATGENGAQGPRGEKGDKGDQGDSMFKAVTQDETYVYFILNNGTTIKVTKLTESGATYFEQTVMDHMVDSMIIDKTEIDLRDFGQTDTITATTYPFRNSTVTWESSKPSVATVENGIVTAVDAGITTITASSAGHVKQCTVRVHVNGVIAHPIYTGSSSYVLFSKGNLQYQASTKTWRFAENQYDIIGEGNENISYRYSGWIDLFGWGTSGWNSGANAYQPYSTSQNLIDYNVGGNSDNSLIGIYAKGDWGVYNPIMNGGNAEGLWRTLTVDEWRYIIKNTKYTYAKVLGVKGFILYPRNWKDEYTINNVTTIEDWQYLENKGVIFLPFSGVRGGSTGSIYASSINSIYTSNTAEDWYGAYWTSTSGSNARSYMVQLYKDRMGIDSYLRYNGVSVRLVSAKYK